MSRSAPRVGFDRFTEPQFRPYVTAIGELVLAWNSLHEVMGWTYEMMLADFIRPEDHNKGPQVRVGWNALNSDREKRKLLRAATTNLTSIEKHNFPDFAKDVTWILNRADELEDMRNNVVHSPLVLISAKKSVLMDNKPDYIVPEWLSGNRRALGLRAILSKQQELLTEFRWCRDAILTCRDFMVLVNRCWGSVGLAWPETPSLPPRKDKNIRRHR